VVATRILIPGTELRPLHSAAGDTPPDCWIDLAGETNTVCVEIVLAPPGVYFRKVPLLNPASGKGTLGRINSTSVAARAVQFALRVTF